MGFLDSTNITVDAVLTKQGRELLKNGGSINLKIAIVQKINAAGNNIIDCEAGRRGTA